MRIDTSSVRDHALLQKRHSCPNECMRCTHPYLDRLAVARVDKRVRVAHAHARNLPRLAVHHQVLRDHGRALGGRERGGHLRHVEDGLAHVDAHLAVRQQLRLDEACAGKG